MQPSQLKHDFDYYNKSVYLMKSNKLSQLSNEFVITSYSIK